MKQNYSLSIISLNGGNSKFTGDTIIEIGSVLLYIVIIYKL